MNKELTFSEKELEEAIRSLNSKKAPDVYGLTAEHLKYEGSTWMGIFLSSASRIHSYKIKAQYSGATFGVKPLCSLFYSSSITGSTVIGKNTFRH
jgi:hypothetical protein